MWNYLSLFILLSNVEFKVSLKSRSGSKLKTHNYAELRLTLMATVMKIMSGEPALVGALLQQFDRNCRGQAELNSAYAEDHLFNALLSRLSLRRSAADIQHQVQYHLTYQNCNLDNDEFIVTRGC